MCNAAATRTYVGTYVPSLCRDRHRAVETMRFYTSLCPSPAATCSRSPKPISSPGIYLLPLSPPSDDNRILSERALARAISRPICSFLREEPPPSHTHHVHREDFGPGDPLLPVCSLVGYVHARSHAHDSRPGGRFQSGGGGSTRTMRRTVAAAAATTTMAHAKASHRRYETGGYLFPCYMGTLSSA